ncbi:MAG: hypothetical protein EAZ95_15940 [Bacteroidetes bacterium]|nr:MAG: hypothetical protein EAZ95_15940 [Bacteroidota bacterium]
MQELTPREQHIFDIIEAIEYERLKDQDTFYADIEAKIALPLFQAIMDIEIQSARENALLATNDTENDDDVCPNLARLLCSRQKNSFLLAKQLMQGLVFSENALFSLIKSAYDFYLYADSYRFADIYHHEVPTKFSQLRGIAQLLQMDDLTEEERKHLPELELQTKKRLANLFYLSIVGDGEVSSVWLV